MSMVVQLLHFNKITTIDFAKRLKSLILWLQVARRYTQGGAQSINGLCEEILHTMHTTSCCVLWCTTQACNKCCLVCNFVVVTFHLVHACVVAFKIRAHKLQQQPRVLFLFSFKLFLLKLKMKNDLGASNFFFPKLVQVASLLIFSFKSCNFASCSLLEG